jgi:hypothetical protein
MTEIKEVLKAFKFLLPYYKGTLQVPKEKETLGRGLCWAYYNLASSTLLYNIFTTRGHYANILHDEDYLVPYTMKSELQRKFRTKFLKTEIKELQKLLDAGYTHLCS